MPGLRFVPGADTDALAAALERIADSLGHANVLPEIADRVLVVAGEVLANVAEHGATPVRIEWNARPRCVDVSVVGAGPSVATLRAATLPEATATRGRGLFLIAELTDAASDAAGRLDLTFVPRTL